MLVDEFLIAPKINCKIFVNQYALAILIIQDIYCRVNIAIREYRS